MNYDSNAAGRQASSYSQSRRAMLRGAMAVAAVPGVTAATQRASAKSESLALPPVTKNVTPFKVEVAQAALDDLNRRLALTRWPELETVTERRSTGSKKSSVIGKTTMTGAPPKPTITHFHNSAPRSRSRHSLPARPLHSSCWFLIG
jgi:hypothetical protein